MEQANVGPEQTCPHCGHTFTSLLLVDGLVPFAFCPKCDEDFDNILATLVPSCTTCESIGGNNDRAKICHNVESSKLDQKVGVFDACDLHTLKALKEQLDVG